MKDILVVRVGSEDHPARIDDIRYVERLVKRKLKAAGDRDTQVLALHHAVDMFKMSSLSCLDDRTLLLHLFDKGLLTDEELKKKLAI